MKFDDLDKKMRVYETSHDLCVMPGMWMVARLDGRGFTKFANQHFERPFDVKFRDLMIKTSQHLMSQCGFHGVYGYAESDEISILMHPTEEFFNRKIRKLNSVLAGEASAVFTLACGEHATFDCRISQLPTEELVIDYFRWRGADSLRNSLNTHVYWSMRKLQYSGRVASRKMVGMNNTDKKNFLTRSGVCYDELPSWQKNGVGFYWETVQHEGYNPKKETNVTYFRNELKTHMELPSGDDYEKFLREVCSSCTATSNL